MTRLVFETTQTDKAALAAVLQPVGKTFTDWFAEQLVETLDRQSSAVANYTLREAEHGGALTDVQAIASEIGRADWAFANADTGFLTHDVHPYPAKYIPQIPGNLIRRLSCPGELVLDPFGGSGTTATEAVRLGRRALSIDANPLAALMGEVKTRGLGDGDRVKLERLATAVQTYALSQVPLVALNGLSSWVPPIPNIEKWFQANVIGELACVRRLISELTDGRAHAIASLAFSRIIVRVSNQDSETRYVAKDKSIPTGFTIRAFLDSLQTIQRRVEQFSRLRNLSEATFVTADSRTVMASDLAPDSVGLIVTSPPYPNATDYHLYHRFRIFWLGHDPKSLGDVEIGSHLKHQRKNSGFLEYANDMRSVLDDSYRVLAAGRFSVLVVGDAMFDGKTTNTAEELQAISISIGFEHVSTVERPIHATRRSFSAAARRARSERLLILRKPDRRVTFSLSAPVYKLWDYEVKLREFEVSALLGNEVHSRNLSMHVTDIEVSHSDRWKLSRLAFTSSYSTPDGLVERTWQKLLENGDSDASRRKEPKYVTHGIHAFKGKFYPQLAKSLLNIARIDPGAVVLDPFSGSGTILLEGYLNGFRACGCDMNPLAVRISRAKTEVLKLPPKAVHEALASFSRSLRETAPANFPPALDQFSAGVVDEIVSWFPKPVVHKLNWLLGQIRLFGDKRLVNFLEVILSDCIRDVSQQDPTDLRIRRRSEPIHDAPLIELFLKRLETQHRRLVHYWAVASRRPFPFQDVALIDGDSRDFESFTALGLQAGSVDAVITSPPYATALPYIDTDRLSLMAVIGMPSNSRKTVEVALTGSREISIRTRSEIEDLLFSQAADDVLPKELVRELRSIRSANVASNAGFRRLNMPSLLFRYFSDMRANIANVARLLKPGARAYYVVGDSKTEVSGEWLQIRTTDWLMRLAKAEGLAVTKFLDISVTTENMKHIRHAITTNAILQFEKI